MTQHTFVSLHSRFFVFLAGVLAISSTPGSSFASEKSMHCYDYTSQQMGNPIRYCIDRSNPKSAPVSGEPVVFFMHGTNGSAKTWEKNGYEDALDELRKTTLLPSMSFISFDTSRYSFFSDHPSNGGGDPQKAFETWFVNEFVPYSTHSHDLCQKRECRAIMGESMGGFGALKTALKHPELFSTIAVNSPALAAFNVHDPKDKWKEYFEQHPVGKMQGMLLLDLLRSIFPTAESWDENDPVYLVDHYSSSSPFPNLYFDMGGNDFYGFNEGYGVLKDELDKKKIPYTTIYEPTAGHDMWRRHAKDSILFVADHIHS